MPFIITPFAFFSNAFSNAIGPVIGLWIVSTTGNVLMTAKPAVWILFYGGVGISVGLWIWGRKVMETIGTDLTVITPSRYVLLVWTIKTSHFTMIHTYLIFH